MKKGIMLVLILALALCLSAAFGEEAPAETPAEPRNPESVPQLELLKPQDFYAVRIHSNTCI